MLNKNKILIRYEMIRKYSSKFIRLKILRLSNFKSKAGWNCHSEVIIDESNCNYRRLVKVTNQKY